jgi:uncharacterized protein
MLDEPKNVPNEIDIFRLAQAGQVIQGSLAIAKMSRLSELLSDNKGNIEFKLQFGKDENGLYFIKGAFECLLILLCHRCMQPMQVALKHDFALSPVCTDDQAKAIPEKYEPILLKSTDERVLICSMLEDEVILQVPFLAKHEVEQCNVQLQITKVEPGQKKPNPFAVLTALKKKM